MKQLKVPFRLIGISTEQFAFIQENFIDEGELNLGIDFRHGIDYDSKGFTTFFAVQFISDEQIFLKLEVGAHFNIEDEAWNSFIDQEKQLINFPKQLVQHFAVIAVGTARGVLHAKTENTPAHGLLLPTLDLMAIITEDVPFELMNKTD